MMWRLWRLWYQIVGWEALTPPRGHGTRENPLTEDDLRPLNLYLRRTRQALAADGLHDAPGNTVRPSRDAP